MICLQKGKFKCISGELLRLLLHTKCKGSQTASNLLVLTLRNPQLAHMGEKTPWSSSPNSSSGTFLNRNSPVSAYDIGNKPFPIS